MKLSQFAAAAAAFAGFANAQSQCLPLVTAIPQCALGYIAEIAYSSYQCDIIDFGCQCGHLNDLPSPLQASLATFGQSCEIGPVLQPAIDLCNCHTSNAASAVTLEPYQSACEPSAVAIPGCALGYLADAGVAESCQINDFGCQCRNFDAIEGSISAEVSSFCAQSGVAVADVLNSASNLCACVASNSPAGGGGGGTTAPGTTAPGQPAPATTSTGASPTNTVSGGPSPTNTASTGSSSTKAPTSPGTSPLPKQTSSTRSIPVFTGAGATASAFGGFFGVVAGLAAFL